MKRVADDQDGGVVNTGSMRADRCWYTAKTKSSRYKYSTRTETQSTARGPTFKAAQDADPNRGYTRSPVHRRKRITISRQSNRLLSLHRSRKHLHCCSS